jgi:hypothetical protein
MTDAVGADRIAVVAVVSLGEVYRGDTCDFIAELSAF